MDTSLRKKLNDAGYDGDLDLSSLVEACGEGFDGLYRDNFWWAYKRQPYEKDNIRANGKTPEESVAKLWLALNRDKNETKPLPDNH